MLNNGTHTDTHNNIHVIVIVVYNTVTIDLPMPYSTVGMYKLYSILTGEA